MVGDERTTKTFAEMCCRGNLVWRAWIARQSFGSHVYCPFMDNPYTPPAIEEQSIAISFPVQTLVVFSATSALVIANYATAISYPFEKVLLFMHVCFAISPIALVFHFKNLRDSFRESATPGISWILLVLLSIPISFAISLSPFFSENQYERFYVTNSYFGPNDWMQWTWLLILGILPYALVSTRIRSIRPPTGFLSAASICGHAHNAFWVFVVCHSTD